MIMTKVTNQQNIYNKKNKVRNNLDRKIGEHEQIK